MKFIHLPNTQEILVEKRGSVAIITLNRSERMNAFTTLLGAELEDTFARIDIDDEVSCIVVTGAGKAFCAGAEVTTLDHATREPHPTREQYMKEKGLLSCDPFRVRKPIIAAINGHAVGVGLTLPLQFDIRIVAKDAKLGFVFARRGVIPESGSHWILPRVIGLSKASELMMTGRLFSGDEAVELGLASQAVPKDQVLDTAISLAEEIAVNCAPASLALIKKQLWAYLEQPNLAESIRKENDLFSWLQTQADTAEGVNSFLEKRKPSWSFKLSKDLPSDLPSLD